MARAPHNLLQDRGAANPHCLPLLRMKDALSNSALNSGDDSTQLDWNLFTSPKIENRQDSYLIVPISGVEETMITRISDSELCIRLARPADLETYLSLLEEIAEWLDRRGVGQLPPGIHREFSDYFASSIRAGEVYLAFVDDRLVGSLRLVHDGGTVWPDTTDDSLYVENLVVRRQYGGRAIGRQLLLFAERKASLGGSMCIRLDCFANNPVLKKYYEVAGFEPCGEIDAHYPFGTLRLQRYEKRLR